MGNILEVPKTHGAYILVTAINSSCKVRVGSLGEVFLKKGYYAYVGSAMGPGGLFCRIRRHLSRVKRLKWHIDYVLEAGRVICVAYTVSDVKLECEIASLIAEKYSIVVEKLGSTDCRCKSHFFFLGKDLDSVEVFLDFLKEIESRLGVSFSVVWC